MARRSLALLTLVFTVALVIVSSLFAAPPARATAIITAVEVGGDVVLTGSGSLDLTAWTYTGWTNGFGTITPIIGQIFAGSAFGAPLDYYEAPTNFAGPANFGGGTIQVFATSGSGGTFGIAAVVPRLRVPAGYVSGDPVAESSVFAGESFVSVGGKT